MPRPSRDVEGLKQKLQVIRECMEEGFPLVSPGGGARSAGFEAARRIGLSGTMMRRAILQMEAEGIEIDPAWYVPRRAPFTLAPLPDDGELTAEEIIAAAKARHADRKRVADAAALREVDVHIDGPIAIAFFGDPHIDDPGCAWGDLEADVAVCRDTPGFLAVNVGDTTNNWVGRLQRLYADQEVTARQALKLIEWLMTSIPWLLTIKGNHDVWNTEKGDVADYIHRTMAGLLVESDARMKLNLPGGASVTMHVRHDFPGNSQFSPGHALVRETLFGYRDHILACGHRHSTGYIPFWHNDPPRLCHGFRVGAYKDFDHYAREKGFRECNWARSMAAIVDPEHAGDPVRFVKPFFSLAEAAEYLTWLRSKRA